MISKARRTELTAIALTYGAVEMIRVNVRGATEQEKAEIRAQCMAVGKVAKAALQDEAFQGEILPLVLNGLDAKIRQYLSYAYPDKGKIPARALTSACLLHLDEVGKPLESAELRRPGRNPSRKRKLYLLGVLIKELLALDEILLAQDTDDGLGLGHAERAGKVLREIVNA